MPIPTPFSPSPTAPADPAVVAATNARLTSTDLTAEPLEAVFGGEEVTVTLPKFLAKSTKKAGLERGYAILPNGIQGVIVDKPI